MDPNKLLRTLLDTMACGDRENAEYQAEDLRDWFKRGGFLPDADTAEEVYRTTGDRITQNRAAWIIFCDEVRMGIVRPLYAVWGF